MPTVRQVDPSVAPRDATAFSGATRAAALAAAPAVLAVLRGRRARAVISALGSVAADRPPAQLVGSQALGWQRLGSVLRRHPLAPAALRIERSRGRGENGADQVAVTVWFGDGPPLPGVGRGRSGVRSTALRLGVSVLGAAAVAAATAAAARLGETERRLIVDGTAGDPLAS